VSEASQTRASTAQHGQIVIIAALDCRHAIGRAGTLPWHLPEDLRRFKRLTWGKTVLMGRTTALAVGRPLPGRRNLVLTRGGAAPFAEQRTVPSLEAALSLVGEDELWVIGGGKVYALALPFAVRMYLTWVDATIPDADAFFPQFDPSAWREVARAAHTADSHHAHAFTFVDYARAAGSVRTLAAPASNSGAGRCDSDSPDVR
jgi:dihydrofolate reductase